MEMWRRNLFTIWGAQFTAMVGMSMVIPFLPFYIRELGVTDAEELQKWSGIVFSGTFVFSFLLTPLWGALGDRFGRKAMVLRAIFGLAVSQFLIALASNVFELFIFRLVQGAISGFIAASLALVTAGTPKERSGYAIGILQTSISAGTIIGPLIGGLLADITTYRNVFFITSAVCLLSGFAILFFVKEPVRTAPNIRYTVRDNYRYLFGSKVIKNSLIAITIIQISITMAQPIFALFIETIAEGSEYLSTLAGGIFGITGLFTVIGSPWWGKRIDTKSFRKTIFFAMLGSAAAFILHSFVTNPYYLFPVRAFLGFCIGGLVPSLYAYINKHIDEGRKGGVMGIASSFTLFGNLVGPLMCTLFVSYIPLHYIFLISALFILINIFFFVKPQQNIHLHQGFINNNPDKIN